MSRPDPTGPASVEPGPCLGLDLGEVRIGVSVTDSARTVAIPRGVVTRSGHEAVDHEMVAQLVEEVGATLVVVGVPLSLDGRIGPAAGRVIAETARLADALRVPVETIDERFSTVEATRRRGEVDSGHARRHRMSGRLGRRRSARGRSGPAAVDAGAAAVILQSYLDRERPR